MVRKPVWIDSQTVIGDDPRIEARDSANEARASSFDSRVSIQASTTTNVNFDLTEPASLPTGRQVSLRPQTIFPGKVPAGSILTIYPLEMHTNPVIIIKSPREIEQLKRSNAIVAEVFRELRKMVVPGVTTQELDRMAEEFILSRGAIPAFKGYRNYPATLCVSINEEVVHGIPGPRKLREGDIVSIDVGVNLNGYFGDAAITLPVGEVDQGAKRLLEVTEKALHIGIEMARVGNRLHDISHAIQKWVEGKGFSVVREFVGHGIGKNLHEEPQVPNFGSPGQGPRLEKGMVFALEPMVNEGSYEVRILSDGWTVVTADGKRSAHFEHTIAITDGKAEILSTL